MLLLTNSLTICSFLNHVRITETEYPELEVTHNHHWVQLLLLDRTTPKMFTAFLYYFFLNAWKGLLLLRRGNLEQPECRHGKRVWSCRWAHRLLSAVADHSRGHTVCEITMPSIIIIIVRIYNVENPMQINKQTISSWGDTDTQLSQPNQREWICISKKQLSSPQPALCHISQSPLVWTTTSQAYSPPKLT